MSEEINTSRQGARRYRPSGRVSEGQAVMPSVLTRDFQGAAAAYRDTLLFIGFEVDSRIEIVVYPRYRFGSDDRVQGHLGTLWFEPGTPWEQILSEVDKLHDRAQTFYQSAMSLRSSEMRAHGARFERAYDAIAEVFRESWHGFSLRLRRNGQIEKEGMVFEGTPPAPVLVKWRGEEFTLLVAPTGSILLLRGDRRSALASL